MAILYWFEVGGESVQYKLYKLKKWRERESLIAGVIEDDNIDYSVSIIHIPSYRGLPKRF